VQQWWIYDWQGRTAVLGEKPVLLPHCPVQTPHALAWDSTLNPHTFRKPICWRNVKRPLDGQYYYLEFLLWINILQHASPYITQYYCAMFHVAGRSGLVNMSSESDTDSVAICFSLAFKKEQKLPLNQRMVQIKTTIHIDPTYTKILWKAKRWGSQTTIENRCNYVIHHVTGYWRTWPQQ
jgi:hypothetical protein